ncbi:SDR family oxidoreductase [Mycolicibacterium arseniciresistens]|uniref:SDR family oxidoreductase n=1 Tax=Mycolicibacterium arseniciresistens TaxID=3062257 RepID=A0ABT8UFH2_9MYCO|nr:SDR family oxidoreductase [Mycolicibacterium arseniciresistens]MDO3635635.1 SDR family oxidoreductase [Mycolicibacterium arseniciresistens]
MTSVRGKVVVITGGARGVGEELARRLHAKGASLVLTDLDEGPLAALAGDLGEDRVLTVVADVSDLKSMQEVAEQAVARLGGIDIVIANAGIASYGSVLVVDPDAFRRVLDVNIVGVFNTVRATLPSLIDRKGYVLVVSSLAAFAAAPGMAPYDASKAGVEQFANALRLEAAHHGVGVGCAHMSWIDTPLVQDTKSDLPSFVAMLDSLPGPLSRTTSVQECGEVFVKGIERRKDRIYCPRWVGLARWFKPVLTTRIGQASLLKAAPKILPQMDAEVTALKRSLGARTHGLKK